jgi:hypothetical protein
MLTTSDGGTDIQRTDPYTLGIGMFRVGGFVTPKHFGGDKYNKRESEFLLNRSRRNRQIVHQLSIAENASVLLHDVGTGLVYLEGFLWPNGQ